MAECYPTGCPPCAEEISFPENPVNGQRECFFIGKDPNTNEDIHKCWVYDHCIPGWRAEGPSASPANFVGQVDLTKTPAEQNIAPEAGDYYVVAVGSAEQAFLNLHWADLQHPILPGAYILWTGSVWMEIPRPCGDGPEQVGPVIDLSSCGACDQVLEMRWGFQPVSLNIPDAPTEGQSELANITGSGSGMRVLWTSGQNTNNVVSIMPDPAFVGGGYKGGDRLMLTNQDTWGFLGYFTNYQDLPAAGDVVENAATTNASVGTGTGLTVDYQIRRIGGSDTNKWVWVKANTMGTGINRGDTFTIDGLAGVEIRYDAPSFTLSDVSDEIFLTQTKCDPSTIGCDFLPVASDTNRGIVQLATNLDPTSPGYYSDAVTPALLQRIVDTFRQDELDIGDLTQVSRHYSEDSVWRPLNPNTLQKITVQLIGGGGGGGPNGPIVATDHTGNPVWNPGDSGGSSQWGITELTAAQAGTEAQITIGQGGQPSTLRLNEEGGFLATAGTATIFSTNGTIGQILQPGGRGGRDLVASTGGWPSGWVPTWGDYDAPDPADPVNVDSNEVNYEISGKGGGGVRESEYDNSFSPGNTSGPGNPGYMIITEYYTFNGRRIYNY